MMVSLGEATFLFHLLHGSALLAQHGGHDEKGYDQHISNTV